jgi:hypothetical protein
MTESLLLWNARIIDGRGGPGGRSRGDLHRRRADRGDRPERERGSTTGGGRPRGPDGAARPHRRHAHVSSDTERSPGFELPELKHGADPRPKDLRYFLLANMARAFLRAGITSVRDVGSYDNEAIVLRRALELGLVDGPRLLSCGRILTATSPGARIFGTMYREADGPWEMRKAVREQIRDGATSSRSWRRRRARWSARTPSPRR